MSKVLWIVNKYLTGQKNEKYFPLFLKYVQDGLIKEGHQLSFIFFSNMFISSAQTEDNFIYQAGEFSDLSSEQIKLEAIRIERDYNFTFKQAFFSDLLQTSTRINSRNIHVPENEFNDLTHLVKRFLFLENLIVREGFDVIFSDVSPEAEMEFGRAIGYKLNKIVLKTYEGSALGRTVFKQHYEFGKDRLVEEWNELDFTSKDAKLFCEDFIKNQRLPYVIPPKYSENITLARKLSDKFRGKSFRESIKWIIGFPFRFVSRKIFNIYLWIEEYLVKPIIRDKFDPTAPYFFMGFHLNQESTMALRAMPYTNQVCLVEMISRVLPYGYYLYVRGHPHWPKTFKASYLNKARRLPNVRLISDNISIHEIIRNSKGILTYNANTGIEALIYGKPVLSFASNIYYGQHPGVEFCSNLFDLGAKLTTLANKEITDEDTYRYIHKLMHVSFDMLLGSSFFLSEEDAREKAGKFAANLIGAINWCKNSFV